MSSLLNNAIRIASTITLSTGLAASAATFFVSPSGNDSNSGTSESPFSSLHGAREHIRNSAKLGVESIEVIVEPGIYYLDDTIIFDSKDSGNAENQVTYRAREEGTVILSGGSKLDLKWEKFRDGIYKTTTPLGISIDQLFVNGKNQRMARYPNYDPKKKTAAYQGFSSDAFAKDRAKNWKNPINGYIHAMHKSRWGGYHYRITGKDSNGEITYEGGWQNNRQMGMHKDFRMVENIFEELDAPGEWFHNSSENTLYYFPGEKTDLKTATIEVVRLRHLIEFDGSETSPVTDISLEGFVFRHAARTFMDTKEPLLRSDWAIYRGGAVTLSGTENISLLHCEFDQVGGNAIFVNNYNRHTLIKGCHIHDAGASGVCFVGDPNAVRDPLFEYAEKNDLSKIDLTVGPKNNNYPSLSTVEDCLIHGIGRVERQPAGVQISMAMEITVRDTSIYDCARAGINVSEGTWGGHLIERCDVFDTVLETHDHGSFNSWGRDRFWSNDHHDSTQPAVDANPELPFIDAFKTTVIRDSRWRCDHGWDIDLDDGSSNYHIYNNLMLRGGLKFREGFGRHAWNNITVNNGFHPHVWFENSKDEVYKNIFMVPHRDIRVNFQGNRVDENIFYSNDESMKESPEGLGWDEKSIVTLLEFIDPKNGDFRVKENTLPREIGFTNFPMDQFGVKKPSLKAIARTPIIPELQVVFSSDTKGTGEVSNSFWMGGRLQNLSGEEFSAYGISKEEGGIVVTDAPAGSVVSSSGMSANDVIQKVNGKQVSNISEFLTAIDKVGNAPITLTIIRNQLEKKIEVVR
ncbi:right-handed parallel beta-helix repeat-containing protein [Puniceicoccaceae bacterium K14]|nr:right-handed parallel beta-helix repeat-containing protein [Puniceicoccaceae bacterium K14]